MTNKKESKRLTDAQLENIRQAANTLRVLGEPSAELDDAYVKEIEARSREAMERIMKGSK